MTLIADNRARHLLLHGCEILKCRAPLKLKKTTGEDCPFGLSSALSSKQSGGFGYSVFYASDTLCIRGGMLMVSGWPLPAMNSKVKPAGEIGISRMLDPSLMLRT